MSNTEEELKILDAKLKQLKLAYDQYFLGARPRLPSLLRREVDKMIVYYSNHAITNTSLRFKFSSICSRFNAFKRQWEDIQRKIENGTYERHVFKANLHARDGMGSERAAPPGKMADSFELFNAYVEARQACGQDIANLSRKRVRSALEKQVSKLGSRHGADVRFQVVVESGKAKIRAVKGGE